MKSLVTGGAGFIGSHLVDRLLEDGHQVTVLDNFSTGRVENLGHVPVHLQHKLNVVRTDLSSEKIDSYFTEVDWVFHLAALADIVPSIERPREYHDSNVTGTIAVLAASQQAAVKRFIYAASSSCYGIPATFPTPEHAPIQPQYPYALTKYLGEEYVRHWAQVYGLPAVSMRFFNVYGPRSRTSGTYGAVFGVFLAQKLAGHPFTVVGDGTQTRDFTFVTDVVSALVAAARSSLTNEVMNVGSGATVSVNRLVELLDGPVTYIPKRPGEPDCTFADTAKIERLLGWRPKVSIEQGVNALLDNIDYWRNAPVWTPAMIADATKGWHQFLGAKE